PAVGDQRLAILGKNGGIHRLLVLSQDMALLDRDDALGAGRGADFPQAHVLDTTQGERFAVRREGQGIDGLLKKRPALLAGGGIPETHGVISVGRDERPAIW